MSVRVVVPMAPDRALLPNVRRRGRGGAHWSVQAEATAELRAVARLAAVDAVADRYPGPVPVFGGPVVVAYEVIWPFARYKRAIPLPDPCGIPTACKAILDGIVDAGLIADDSGEYVAEIRARGRRGEAGEAGRVIVTIEEAAG